VSVPSRWQAPLSDEAPEAFIIKIVNLGGERESLFLGGFLIFVWSAPYGLVVVRIHDNHNPPTIVLITSDADLDGVRLHVGFVQTACLQDLVLPRSRDRLDPVRFCSLETLAGAGGGDAASAT